MRNTARFASIATTVALAATLAACGTTNPNQPVSSYPTSTYPTTYPQGSNLPVAGLEYGRITNIEYLPGSQMGAPGSGTGSTAGTIIGGVAGAVLGNQIGGGSGRAAATILGGVAGAVVGNRIGKNRDGTAYTGPAYRVTVQTDQGAWRTYEVGSTGDLRVGDRVRVENGVIYRG
jgi:outer membrane lipoprotein SlyB